MLSGERLELKEATGEAVAAKLWEIEEVDTVRNPNPYQVEEGKVQNQLDYF